MSERRMARSKRSSLDDADDGLPACLQLGCCVEVWAERDVTSDPRAATDLGQIMSARRRFHMAREGWLAARSVDPAGAEGSRLIPDGAPWSIQTFIAASGEQGPQKVAAQSFAAVGLDLDDLYEVRDMASRLQGFRPRRITGPSLGHDQEENLLMNRNSADEPRRSHQ